VSKAGVAHRDKRDLLRSGLADSTSAFARLPSHLQAVTPRHIMTQVLTLIANRAATSLTQAVIARVRDAVAGGEPVVLSPGEAADIPLRAAPNMDAVRAALDGAAIDAIATEVAARRKRLLVADMDSTIVTGETLDELADFAGLKPRIAAITARAMNGELDFKAALRERVAMLRGLPVDALERTWERVRLTPGALDLVATMRAHGARAALVSGGFSCFTSRVAALCGFDLHRSNVLLDDGAVLTGFVTEPILDRDTKLATLTDLAAQQAVPMSATLAVGDGANDLDMLAAAGLGVAFHAKPIVAAAAQARVDHADLRALLFAQGYRAAQFVDPGGGVV
jgi:phosphoserine phosphatase